MRGALPKTCAIDFLRAHWTDDIMPDELASATGRERNFEDEEVTHG